MKNLWRESILLVTISSLFCLINSTTISNPKTANSETMNNLVSIVEIPVTNNNRAVKFYESILDIEIQSIDMQGTEMGIFPSDGQSASVVLTKGEGYEPASSGVLVHLNGGEDLE
ncbi:MAG: VOC family protein, partial [Roseivirga sp.]|nr:VOC family protein [Roseivirga sp.]